MKVYSISKWAFYSICVLILALPVSRQWKLLVNGKKTTGTVTDYTPVSRETPDGMVTIDYVSKIEFIAGDSTCLAYGPRDYEYESGRTLRILYDPENPSNCCILSFSGFYLNNYLVLPLILLVLWAAFYLSFNKYVKPSRRKPTKRSGDNRNTNLLKRINR